MAWGWLKKLGRGVKTAAPIALMFTPPPFQAVAQTVYSAIVAAESAGGAGPEKLQNAMRTLEWSAPLIAREVERITGRDVVNEEALADAMQKLAEFQVLIVKAVGGKPE
jgi:hypothetical protein